MKSHQSVPIHTLLRKIQNIPYVFIKTDATFPLYHKGQDIDIFCYNKKQFAQQLFAFGNKYINNERDIRVIEITKWHTHIDFMERDEIHIRFDLYEQLPQYRNIRIKPGYFYSIIENAISQQYTFQKRIYTYYIPSKIDNLLLRYIEYIEYYQLRPDKIKHLTYVLREIRAHPDRISFLDKLHIYTDLPNDFEMFSKYNLITIFFNRLKLYGGRIFKLDI